MTVSNSCTQHSVVVGCGAGDGVMLCLAVFLMYEIKMYDDV